MRPSVLFPLFSELTTLPGVGPRLAQLLGRAAGGKVIDLVWHLPTGVIDRRYRPLLAAAETGRIATVTVTVVAHFPPDRAKQPYRVYCSDESGTITLVFFHPKPEYLQRVLPVAVRRTISGRIESFGGTLQMVHPDHIVDADACETLAACEPVYPLSEGLSAPVMRRAVAAALNRLPALEEWLDPALRSRRNWPSWQEAVTKAHAPADDAELDPASPARSRLAYDELLANQLALALIRRRMKVPVGRAVAGGNRLAAIALAALGFSLTAAQERALAEITADLATGNRMLRLLQGDVGSGKTVVAALAMLAVIENGAQAAMLAPTEILARQHFATLEPLARAAGVECACLIGRTRLSERRTILEGLASGRISLVVGTQALIQDDVAFADLGLAVIDEQHRFGVNERLKLAAKGRGTHVLVMTATPIPRTLTLSLYGDLDVSLLTEKPPGRQLVDTRVISTERLDDVIAAIGRSLGSGVQAYWVCPLVAQSEALDLAAAEERAARLRRAFGGRVGLIHGRLGSAAKDAVMRGFGDGTIAILVATTVIEVGIDVPAASVMVIEHADRFGLAQLHQLRGRIGRGSRPSTCILLYTPPLNETARSRLSILKESDDGFRIAEEDLRLRGAGELLGVRQSGMPAFRLADPAAHGALFPVARDDARLILDRDPELKTPRGKALRTLLYLFERDSVVGYLRSG